MFDDASDQDSTDKPWRRTTTTNPKKKSRQLRKMSEGQLEEGARKQEPEQ